jgi:hypothetical protein
VQLGVPGQKERQEVTWGVSLGWTAVEEKAAGGDEGLVEL